MELKKDILFRTYLIFIGMALLCVTILGKAFYIQTAEGKYWRSKADSTHITTEIIEAERGTIYSEDGQMLSTSVPEFDVYIDYMAHGLRDRNGLLFRQHVDSLAYGLAGLFKDKTKDAYKKELQQGFRNEKYYSLLKRKISFTNYEALKKLPLVNLGRNKSGFIPVVRMKRLYPFKALAYRTIGIARDSNNVGLEKMYDSSLSGVTGKRLVRYIAGGAGVPLEGTELEPRDGCDIITTLDVSIQDAAQEALQKMMIQNEAERGTCIVLEVKTGKIKAIANLGRMKDGSYAENYNYAISATEPGSTWKLVTLLSVLEDKKFNLSSTINLGGGRWDIGGDTVFDSEEHGLHEASVKKAFEMSSNVGMAKLAYNSYYNQPSKYIQHIRRLHLDSRTGVDLPGESRPNIHTPDSKLWSKTTLMWMSFGYNLTITPLHTAMLYNAIANNGKMMKPYLVNALVKDGKILKAFEPVTLNAKVCNDTTLAELKACLEGVVTTGTAHKLETKAYTIAGKTGTALVADKGITYTDKMYQSSFVGYFPADNPQYTIAVVIRNKPHAASYYGGAVAGPVFREISDNIFSSHIQRKPHTSATNKDSATLMCKGRTASLKKIITELGLKKTDSTRNNELANVYTGKNYYKIIKGTKSSIDEMPSLYGFGLKDALTICEERKLSVIISGKGKVQEQSILAGTKIRGGENIYLQLN